MRTSVALADHSHRGRQLTVTAALLLFCFALMVSDLDWRDMWYDEVGDFLIAAEPLPAILAASRAGSLDPPLYYYLMHLWSAVAGRSEFALRFPSVLLVTLAAATTFAWAQRWLGFSGGWTAALLLGIMPPVVTYAQEVNQYAGLIFFTSLAIWVVDRLGSLDPLDWRAALVWAGVCAAGLGWHYGFAWCWLSLGLVFLLCRPDRAALLRWGTSQIIVVIAAGALFVLVLDAQLSVASTTVYLQHAYPTTLDLFPLFRFFGIAWLNILVFFVGGYYAHSMTLAFAGVGLWVGGIVAGALARFRSKRKQSQPLLYLGVLSLILMAASLLKLYPFSGRQVIMLAPLFAALLAWAWGALPRPLGQLGLLLTAGVLALGWPHSWATGYSHGENTRALIAQFESHVEPDDNLFVYAESARTWRYYRRAPDPDARHGQSWAYDRLDDVYAEMDAAVSGAPRTWLAFTRCLNVDGVCATLFETIPDRYCQLSRWERGQSRLFLVQSCTIRGGTDL